MDAIIVLGAAVAFCVVLVLLLLMRQQKFSNHMTKQDRDYEALANTIRKLQTVTKTQEEKLFELTTAVSGMSDKLQTMSRHNSDYEAGIEEEFKKLQEKLQELESADPGARMYTKAAKLVSSGATIEEVMQECDLPRAEAELLMNLHTQQS